MKYFIIFLVLFISCSRSKEEPAKIEQKENLNQDKQTVVEIKKEKLRSDLNGTLLQKPGDIDIYWIDRGYRRHIVSPTVLSNIFKVKEIVKYPDLLDITEGNPIDINCKLVKCNTDPKIYFLDNGIKRHITSPEVLDKYNFNFDKVNVIDCAALDAIPVGTKFK